MSKMNSNQKHAKSDKMILAKAWQEFLAHYPLTEACVEHIFQIAKELGSVTCRVCNTDDIGREIGSRTGKCANCKNLVWITSGTLFDHVKNPQAWLGAIWLMERGHSLTSKGFAEVAGIAQSSALNILKKLRLVIFASMGESGVPVSSGFFSNLFCKRSQETPARAHPVTEQAEVDKKFRSEAEVNSNQDIAPFSLVEETNLLALLGDKPVSIDALCEAAHIPVQEVIAAIGMLELSGAVTSVPGGKFIRAPIPEQRPSVPGESHMTFELEQNIATAVKFLKTTFHGISRKALQFYLADYWCAKDQKRWGKGALLSVCLTAERITDEDIRDYVSPPLVIFRSAPT